MQSAKIQEYAVANVEITEFFVDGFSYIVTLRDRRGGIRIVSATRRGGLLSDGDANPKTAKNPRGLPYRSFGLAMLPALTSAAKINLCPHAGQCLATCLAFSGHGKFPEIIAARAAMAHVFDRNNYWFIDRLNREIWNKIKLCKSQGTQACFRLNMFTDVDWAEFLPIEEYEAIFYDYSKDKQKVLTNRLRNYAFSYSASERDSDSEIIEMLRSGNQISMVFQSKDDIPETWHGYDVVSGDVDDFIFTRPAALNALYLKAPSNHAREIAARLNFVRELETV